MAVKKSKSFKAVLVKFGYEVDTGDECKGVRLEKREDRGVLFSGPDGVGKVLFLTHRWHKDRGEFFALTGEMRGSRYPKAPDLEYPPGTYDECAAPETELRVIRKLEVVSDEVIRFVLDIPIARKMQERVVKDCIASLD